MTAAIDATLRTLQHRLLTARNPGGGWSGSLSSSALATATAVTALAVTDATAHAEQIVSGLRWLANNVNDDGGWGDTPVSRTNLPTTLLSLAALRVGDRAGVFASTTDAAEASLRKRVGSLEPSRIVEAVTACYGSDRTFAAPILTACAISGLLGEPSTAWASVPALPLELAVLPHRLLRWARAGVVSYALPALIAIGASVFRNRPPRSSLTRAIRAAALPTAVRKLLRIQPASGGFLEAAPLTAFVVMNLSSAGMGDHEIVHRGLSFLREAVRPDGSWPIDTNLSTWVTTLAIAALPDDAIDQTMRRQLRRCLLARQQRTYHPYTGAAPGGWAWTDLSGGVPDADDTAGALLALRRIGDVDGEVVSAAAAGSQWLIGIQNADGGIPTFCRGWGQLPFDRSCPDLTAHAARALSAWAPDFTKPLRARAMAAVARCLTYLADAQEERGTWRALWFGNESAPDQANRTYGTARVLLALTAMGEAFADRVGPMRQRAVDALLAMQGACGGWGGDSGVPASIEETAVAVEALAAAGADVACVQRGADYLVQITEGGTLTPAAPIGLYFASLWYSEDLYPILFPLRALRQMQSQR